MRGSSLLVLLAVMTGCGRDGADGPQGLSGPTGLKGDKGEPGPGFNATPAIAAVSPSTVVPGQTVDIAITGAATEWTSGVIVNFGVGISVQKVLSPSPLALIVTVSVDKTAATGLRDLTVTQNGKVASWKGAFRIDELTRVEVFGKPGRGALAVVRITSNDPNFTFDTSWSGSAYLGVKATSSPASAIFVQDVKPRSVDLLVSGDIDSVLGMRDLRVVNQPGRATERVFTFPQLYDFVDLAENTVDAGTAYPGTFDKAYGSAQYRYQGSSGVELVASVTNSGGANASSGNPMLAVMTSAGKFTGVTVPFVNSYTFSPYTTPFYFVVFDPTGSGPYSYSFSVAPLARTTETEPNDTRDNASALTLPSLQSAGFSAGTDLDWFKVTVTEAELGRHLRVRTRYGQTGQYSTDSKIEVYRPDGTLFAGPIDLNYHEDLRTDALGVPGEWTIQISYGTYYASGWTTYRSLYELLVNWE